MRKAAKILEAAWLAGPHPDIAAAYGNLRFGDSARERRARVKRLVDKGPAHIEGALALAQASLEAGDFAAARATLAPYVPAADPPRRDLDGGDRGSRRRRRPRARMDGARDARRARSGVDRRRRRQRALAAGVAGAAGGSMRFQWKLPVAEIGVERPPIEPGSSMPARAGARACNAKAARRRNCPRARRAPPARAAPNRTPGRGSGDPAGACARRSRPRSSAARCRSGSGADRAAAEGLGPRSASCFVSAGIACQDGHLRLYQRRQFTDSRRSSAVEHPLRKRVVGGSNPSAGTTSSHAITFRVRGNFPRGLTKSAEMFVIPPRCPC